ncbi:MAG: hypothetical protein HYY20_08900 [Candidatus Tectomicrobia bacterium]|uniref:Uncharacterized protein n=1 Tax=Tectimicrobiota bacterium TaxID=2528274 RepID=A0A932G183_UNCTE|nr:hypothetical protein [Candidatus Tectomicrobia bacterium]
MIEPLEKVGINKGSKTCHRLGRLRGRIVGFPTAIRPIEISDPPQEATELKGIPSGRVSSNLITSL